MWGCGSVAGTGGKSPFSAVLQFLGCDMDKCKIVFNFQKFRNLALKKGANFDSLLQEKSGFCLFKRGKKFAYFSKKSILLWEK